MNAPTYLEHCRGISFSPSSFLFIILSLYHWTVIFSFSVGFSYDWTIWTQMNFYSIVNKE